MKTAVILTLLLSVMVTAEEELPDTNDIWLDLTKEIAVGVAITEGMNWMYANQKKIWAPIKGLERFSIIQSMLKVAYVTYDNYISWKKLMDNIAGFVDNMEQAKNTIESASRTVEAIVDYYENFKWDELRLTNLSSVLPMYRFSMLDYYLNGALFYASQALDHLALSSIILEDVVRNPARVNRIAVCNKAVAETYANIARQNKLLDDPVEGLPSQLEALSKGMVKSSNEMYSGEQYHAGALLASLSYDLHHSKIRVVNASLINTAMILDLITSEARDWEKEREFIQGLSKGDWQSKCMFGEYAPVIFNRDLDLTLVNDND